MTVHTVLGQDSGSQGKTDLSDGTTVEMPLLTRRARSFAAVFGISSARASALMPTSRLRPVIIRPGRALAIIQIMEYLEKSIEPYREFTVSIPVRRDSRVALPFYDLAGWARSRSGIYITHIGVDNHQAQIVGREVLGFPKVLSDVQFHSTPTSHSAEVTVGGASVLTLSVRRAAERRLASRQLDFYCHSLSPIDNKVLYIPYQSESSAGFALGTRSARLHLGDHPIAREIRDLDIANGALIGVDIPQYALVSNRPDGAIDAGAWRDPRHEYRTARATVTRPSASADGGESA